MTPHQIIADHTPLGDGFSAEFRADGSIAISHEQGGLHMANSSEAAMAHEIKRLRALVAEPEALPAPFMWWIDEKSHWQTDGATERPSYVPEYAIPLYRKDTP